MEREDLRGRRGFPADDDPSIPLRDHAAAAERGRLDVIIAEQPPGEPLQPLQPGRDATRPETVVTTRPSARKASAGGACRRTSRSSVTKPAGAGCALAASRSVQSRSSAERSLAARAATLASRAALSPSGPSRASAAARRGRRVPRCRGWSDRRARADFQCVSVTVSASRGMESKGTEQAYTTAVRFHREANRRHAGKPFDPAAADESLKRGPGLILPLMAEQQVEDARPPAPAGEKREGARRGPPPGWRRAGGAGRPSKGPVRDGAGGEPTLHLGGLGPRFPGAGSGRR